MQQRQTQPRMHKSQCTLCYGKGILKTIWPNQKIAPVVCGHCNGTGLQLGKIREVQSGQINPDTLGG